MPARTMVTMNRSLPPAAGLILCAMGVFLAGCSPGQPEVVNHKGELPPLAAPAEVNSGQQADNRPVIVVFGDSLSAGHGLLPGEAFPDHLQKLLDKNGFRFRVVNQGLSGDTTTGGLARVDQALALKPKLVLLELGGNDGLRGVPPKSIYDNLEKLVLKFTSNHVQVVVLGISLPKNYGEDYIGKFENNYKTLAYNHELEIVPFLLKGIWTEKGVVPGMVQEDGIHPTAQGTPIMAETVFEVLKRVLRHIPQG